MKALIVVDMENDFMPGGALGVKGGDEIIPVINSLMPKFPLVVAALDWHPPNHCSFAATHPGKKVGDVVKEQILWPVHCVQNTKGSDFPPELDQRPIAAVFHKGADPSIDSYSAFYDNGHQKSTGLTEYLKSRNVTDIYLVGIATDYCILYSALDALDDGFHVTVITNGCRGINLHPHDVEKALALIVARGAHAMESRFIL